MRKRRTPWGALLRNLLLPAICILVLVGFSTALNGLNSGHEAEDQRQLEEALRRGCVACYAAEGVYPPNLDYLKEHYGVQVDMSAVRITWGLTSPVSSTACSFT